MSQQHKLYRADQWLNAVYDVIGEKLDGMDGEIEKMISDITLDTASEEAIQMYERELNIVPSPAQTITDRASTIEAKWKQSGKNSIMLMQQIADSWENGAVAVTFEGGILEVTFISIYGIPGDLITLQDALEEVKPAHLPMIFTFKYHVWNEYGPKTWIDMEAMTWDEVLGGN